VVLTDEIRPLAEGSPVFLDGVDPVVAARYAKVVETRAEADFAIVRRSAPFQPRGAGFESFFHAGRLTYTPSELAPILQTTGALPTVVDILLDRPAVLPELAASAAALTGSFGASDEALLDILFGRSPATGTLPFELPSSAAAVAESREDVPKRHQGPPFPVRPRPRRAVFPAFAVANCDS
jgi:beta-glucosidase